MQFIKTRISKITGEQNQKAGTYRDETAIKAIGQEIPASGNSGGNKGIPAQIRQNMSGEEESNTPQTELP